MLGGSVENRIEQLPRDSKRNSRIASMDAQLGSLIDSFVLGNGIEQTITELLAVMCGSTCGSSNVVKRSNHRCGLAC